MSYLSELTEADRQRCLGLMAEAGGIRTHRELHRWLTCDAMQSLLPHRALIAAWGDFHGGAIRYDIVSVLADVRTGSADGPVLAAHMKQLFVRWSAATRQPCAFNTDVLMGSAPGLPVDGSFVLVHALRDLRTSQHCCYALWCDLGADEFSTTKALDFLLPFVDMAFAKVHPLTTSESPPVEVSLTVRAPRVRLVHASDQVNSAGALSAGMSDRELEIMRWVEMGKTNQEIGTILDISAFTVKNHLQRIFKKLDVYSRAQAVSRLKDSMFYG